MVFHSVSLWNSLSLWSQTNCAGIAVHQFSSTCFSQKQCIQLDGIYRSHTIAKMGHCSKTPTCTINSSHLHGGMNMPDSWNLQGCMHSQLLLGHLQLQDLTAQTTSHSLDALHLHVGLSPRVLSCDMSLTKNTSPPCCLTHTWEYLSSLSATLNYDSLSLPPPKEKMMFHWWKLPPSVAQVSLTAALTMSGNANNSSFFWTSPHPMDHVSTKKL